MAQVTARRFDLPQSMPGAQAASLAKRRLI
jgi:hypothetical protein